MFDKFPNYAISTLNDVYLYIRQSFNFVHCFSTNSAFHNDLGCLGRIIWNSTAHVNIGTI